MNVRIDKTGKQVVKINKQELRSLESALLTCRLLSQHASDVDAEDAAGLLRCVIQRHDTSPQGDSGSGNGASAGDKILETDKVTA